MCRSAVKPKKMELKTFNRWSTEGIKVADPGLISYISLDPKIVPKTNYIMNGTHKIKFNQTMQ